LGLDSIDIVYVHDPDDYVDEVIRVTFPALAKLRDEGVVKAIGAGMNYSEPLLEFVRTSDIDVVMLAGRWTLLDRSGEPLLDECLERGVAVVSAAPFNSGLLSRAQPSSEGHFDYGTVSPELLARARGIAERCEVYGVTLPEAAINFPLRHDAVVSVVAGFRTEQQARTGAQWMDVMIPEALWDELS
jgi:D-threo-aldose 1-dehydrogenase